jgi:hypothetical protein
MILQEIGQELKSEAAKSSVTELDADRHNTNPNQDRR